MTLGGAMPLGGGVPDVVAFAIVVGDVGDFLLLTVSSKTGVVGRVKSGDFSGCCCCCCCGIGEGVCLKGVVGRESALGVTGVAER